MIGNNEWTGTGFETPITPGEAKGGECQLLTQWHARGGDVDYVRAALSHGVGV